MGSGSPSSGRPWPRQAFGAWALMCVALFAVVAGIVIGHLERVDQLDVAVSAAVHASMLAHRAAVPVVTAVTDLGSPLTVGVAAVVAAVAFWKGRWPRAAVALLVSRAGELGIETAVKHGVARPRPSWAVPLADASGFSFPSGHTGGTAMLVVFLLCVTGAEMSTLGRRLACAGGTGVVIVIAASRVVLGVHYPSDVLAGALLGAGCALAGAAAAGSAPPTTSAVSVD